MAVFQETLLDGYVTKFIIESNSRDDVNECSLQVMAKLEEWDQTKIWCAIHDFRAITTLTPTLRTRSDEINDFMTESDLIRSRSVVLLKKSPITFVGKLFVERTLQSDRIRRQVFFNEEESIEWLKEEIEHFRRSLSD